MIEGVLVDDRGDLGADAALGPALFDDHHAVCLAHGGGEGAAVERAERAEVDDFGFDALLAELLGRFEAVADHLGEGDEGDIGAGAHDHSLTDG